uniref:Peptidase M12A domain-containing protein n=1 Tax=Romanomermis culicivorax TaxID=13658 RepID=A0A915L346_ROMCU
MCLTVKGSDSTQHTKPELAYKPENYHTFPQQDVRHINMDFNQEVDGQDYLRRTKLTINTESTYLNPADFAKGRYYMERKEYDWRRPDIRGTGVPLDDEHFEGDYLFFDRSTVEAVKKPSLSLVSASTYRKDRWPDAVVPYIIKDNFPIELRAAIGAAMESIQNMSCVRFVPYELVKDKKKFKILPLVIKKHSKNRCAGSIGLNGTRPNE